MEIFNRVLWRVPTDPDNSPYLHHLLTNDHRWIPSTFMTYFRFFFPQPLYLLFLANDTFLLGQGHGRIHNKITTMPYLWL